MRAYVCVVSEPPAQLCPRRIPWKFLPPAALFPGVGWVRFNARCACLERCSGVSSRLREPLTSLDISPSALYRIFVSPGTCAEPPLRMMSRAYGAEPLFRRSSSLKLVQARKPPFTFHGTTDPYGLRLPGTLSTFALCQTSNRPYSKDIIVVCSWRCRQRNLQRDLRSEPNVSDTNISH